MFYLFFLHRRVEMRMFSALGPFWSHIDTARLGDIYYRETIDTDTLGSDIRTWYGKVLGVGVGVTPTPTPSPKNTF
jgi:hypothetical protein